MFRVETKEFIRRNPSRIADDLRVMENGTEDLLYAFPESESSITRLAGVDADGPLLRARAVRRLMDVVIDNIADVSLQL